MTTVWDLLVAQVREMSTTTGEEAIPPVVSIQAQILVTYDDGVVWDNVIEVGAPETQEIQP